MLKGALVILSLLFGHNALAAITYLQSNSADVSGTATTLQFSSNCTPGSTLFLGIRWGDQNAIYSVSDDKNGAWTGPDVSIKDHGGGAGNTLQIWHFSNNQASTRVTITISQSGNSTIRFGIYEFSGLTFAGTLDKTSAFANTVDSTALDSGSTSTTTQANELFLGVGEADDNVTTFSAGTNVAWTLKETPPTNGTGKFAGEYFIASSSQAADAQFTIGNSFIWAAAVATYKSTLPKVFRNITVKGRMTVN